MHTAMAGNASPLPDQHHRSTCAVLRCRLYGRASAPAATVLQVRNSSRRPRPNGLFSVRDQSDTRPTPCADSAPRDLARLVYCLSVARDLKVSHSGHRRRTRRWLLRSLAPTIRERMIEARARRDMSIALRLARAPVGAEDLAGGVRWVGRPDSNAEAGRRRALHVVHIGGFECGNRLTNTCRRVLKFQRPDSDGPPHA